MKLCQWFTVNEWEDVPHELGLEPRRLEAVPSAEAGAFVFVLDTLDRLWRFEEPDDWSEWTSRQLFTDSEGGQALSEGVADFCPFPGREHTFLVISRHLGRLLLYDYRADHVVQDLTRNLKAQSDSPLRHGCLTTFRSCQSGRDHVILVDREGHAWSWSRHEGQPQSGRVTKGLLEESGDETDVSFTRIDFMDSIRVVSVRTGDYFNIALVEHGLALPRAEASHGNPGDRLSCPLGLPLDHRLHKPVRSRTETSDSSPDVELATQAEEEIGDSAISSQHSSPQQVERLAQSGMYINPADALKYLSEQLAWMNSSGEEGHPAGDPAAQVQYVTTEGEHVGGSGLSRATNAVADGVKLMGRTMSNLSASFSTSADKEAEPGKVDELICDIPMTRMVASHGLNVSTGSVRGKKSRDNHRKRPTTFHRRTRSASMVASLSLSGKPLTSPEGQLLSPTSMVGKYEVWMWGRGKEGQSGAGDTLDRFQPIPIGKLTNKSILKVACGSLHCLALSAFGVVYGWGDNSRGQAHPKGMLGPKLTPKVFELPRGETACDILAQDKSSFVLTDSGRIYKSELHEESKTSFLNFLPLVEIQGDIIPKGLWAQGHAFLVLLESHNKSVREFRSTEKRYLEKLHEILFRVAEFFCDKSRLKHVDVFSEEKDHLVATLRDWHELLTWSAVKHVNIFNLEQTSAMLVLDNVAQWEERLARYHQALCDCLVGDCLIMDNQEFQKLYPVICEILDLKCDTDPKDLGQDILAYLLRVPISHFEHVLSALDAIVTEGRRCSSAETSRNCEKLEKFTHSMRSQLKSLAKDEKITVETKRFWEMAGPKFASVKTYRRRVLLDSRVVPIGVAHSGSFSKHILILMNDLLVHGGYSSISCHPLQTIWIENAQGASELNEIRLIMPEESLTLASPSPEAKNEWVVSLQRAIVSTLNGDKESKKSTTTLSAPITRTTSHTFSKISELRGAKYQGSWMQGKMHGQGVITWSDGRVYRGQLRQNQKHGHGVLEVKSGEGTTLYEGQWKMDKLEGRGFVTYANGDFYEGNFKDGRPHGQGTMKQGRFMGIGASVYIGEWVNGYKQGYGVSDEIISGEKYMGLWQQDMKSGPGCVVTVDGVYYEGSFHHNKMTGKGFMVFEDDTSYEGNFADAGVFSGQGTLTCGNGDWMDGHFHGNYTHGMKFNGTIYKNVQKPPVPCNTFGQESVWTKDKIGRFTVKAEKKWLSIFTGFYDDLSLAPSMMIGDVAKSSVIWEQMAICINQAKNDGIIRAHLGNGEHSLDALDGLEIIPDYHSSTLNSLYYKEVQAYLDKAFTNPLHPLRGLLCSLTDCFNATYGSVRVHPRLLRHSVEELRSIVERIYTIVRSLFPALPRNGDCDWITDDSGSETEISGIMITSSLVIYPHILPKVHSSIFMLYALYYKKDDDDYWVRIVRWNKHSDLALLTFLEVSQKFWQFSDTSSPDNARISQIRDVHFLSAIETLQQLKTKFTPHDKLLVIMETFKQVNQIGQELCGDHFYWSMDELFPVIQFIVVRARILQLGAEIHLMEDMIEPALVNGEFGIMFTTLQASYFQILRESLAI